MPHQIRPLPGFSKLGFNALAARTLEGKRFVTGALILRRRLAVRIPGFLLSRARPKFWRPGGTKTLSYPRWESLRQMTHRSGQGNFSTAQSVFGRYHGR